MWLLRSPVNPKPCGTFSWPSSKSPFSPFLWLQSLSHCLSRVARRSTPKPRGPLPFPQNRVVLFPIYFGAAWSPPSPPKPCGPPLLLWSRVVSSLLQSRMVSPPMAAGPRFKSQHPASFAAPFPTPPTVSYTCQHPRILPALLGCHSKSGQVWPHGMEPIISKLSRRPCNQGELLPSPILGGSHSHLPGSKQGHSYLTYL